MQPIWPFKLLTQSICVNLKFSFHQTFITVCKKLAAQQAVQLIGKMLG